MTRKRAGASGLCGNTSRQRGSPGDRSALRGVDLARGVISRRPLQGVPKCLEQRGHYKLISGFGRQNGYGTPGGSPGQRSGAKPAGKSEPALSTQVGGRMSRAGFPRERKYETRAEAGGEFLPVLSLNHRWCLLVPDRPWSGVG